MKRFPVDLGHYVWSCGVIGRLQGLACIPVLAGDSIGIDIQSLVRMSPYRRPLAIDARMDVYAFFVPHRHIYGDDWLDFVRDGGLETVALPDAGFDCSGEYYLAMNKPAGSNMHPRWRTGGYMHVWNRYFKYPRDDDLSFDEEPDLGDDDPNRRNHRSLFGLPVGPLPRIWNQGIDEQIALGNRTVNTAPNTFDLVALERTRRQFESAQERHWFAQRYDEVMKKVYGTGVSVDADERPTLLMSHKQWLSGSDVMGTDDAALGQMQGVSAATVMARMPNRHMSEHGAIWVLACVRYPSVIKSEYHYLERRPNPSYKELCAEYRLWRLSRLSSICMRMISSSMVAVASRCRSCRTAAGIASTRIWCTSCITSCRAIRFRTRLLIPRSSSITLIRRSTTRFSRPASLVIGRSRPSLMSMPIVRCRRPRPAYSPERVRRDCPS